METNHESKGPALLFLDRLADTLGLCAPCESRVYKPSTP
jgi:hypothetical protein